MKRFALASAWAIGMAAGCLAPSRAAACTTMIVGREATADGSVIVSHSDDNDLMDERLCLVPARDYPEGALRPVYYDMASLGYLPEYGATQSRRYVGTERGPDYVDADLPQSVPLGYIPQVAHTYAYLDGDYGIINEHQLSIGECTCRAKVEPGPAQGKRIFYSSELSRVALERCRTAREAIQLMGDLIAQYGYYATGETLLVGDTTEAWVMEMCAYDEDGTDGIWVARRVPDDHFFVAANQFRIRTVTPDDPDLMYSENLFDVCQAKGWWDPAKGDLDWLVAVSPGEYNHPYYSLRRVWRVLSRVSPAANFSPHVKDGYTTAYPFSVRPDNRLSVQNVIALHRDHYEGTDFDQRLGPGAGPWGSPTRYTSSGDQQSDSSDFRKLKGAWERPVSVFYCGFFYVNQSRDWLPDPVGGLCFFGCDRPYEDVVAPFHCGITAVSDRYNQVDSSEFDWHSAFWAFNLVSNWADLKYSYMIQDIQARQRELETAMFAEIPVADAAAAALHMTDPAAARAYLTDFSSDTAETIAAAWWQLAGRLIAKYSDGFINTPEQMAQQVPYPEWWKKQAGFQNGPKKYGKTRGVLKKYLVADPVSASLWDEAE